MELLEIEILIIEIKISVNGLNSTFEKAQWLQDRYNEIIQNGPQIYQETFLKQEELRKMENKMRKCSIQLELEEERQEKMRNKQYSAR